MKPLALMGLLCVVVCAGCDMQQPVMTDEQFATIQHACSEQGLAVDTVDTFNYRPYRVACKAVAKGGAK